MLLIAKELGGTVFYSPVSQDCSWAGHGPGCPSGPAAPHDSLALGQPSSNPSPQGSKTQFIPSLLQSILHCFIFTWATLKIQCTMPIATQGWKTLCIPSSRAELTNSSTFSTSLGIDWIQSLPRKGFNSLRRDWIRSISRVGLNVLLLTNSALLLGIHNDYILG